jgi:hypothetical protein
VPSRSQRTRSVLSFFAQHASTDTLVYANADLTKATQAHEVLVFADHWQGLTGNWPRLLVMDQKVTTQPVLAELHQRGITFLTLRMRSPTLIRHIDAHPPRPGAPCAWTATAPTAAPWSSTNRPPCRPTPAPSAS